MVVLITGFLYFIFELLYPTPKTNGKEQLNDTEMGAAYFFSTAGMENNNNYTPEQNDPTDGVNW